MVALRSLLTLTLTTALACAGKDTASGPAAGTDAAVADTGEVVAPTPDAATDAPSPADTGGPVPDAAPSDAPLLDTAPSDTTPADVPDATAVSCASFAGAFRVEGQCTAGQPISALTCGYVQGCKLTWEAFYSVLEGEVTGTGFTLATPDGPVSVSGTFTSTDGGTCTLTESTDTCASTVTRFQPALAVGVCCRPGSQDCGEGTACVPGKVVDTAGKSETTTACLPLSTNPGAVGSTCTVIEGQATCAPGLTCRSAWEVGPTAATCRPLCTKPSDCGPTEGCVVLASAPRAGVCVTKCTPLEDKAKSPCPAGTECAPTTAVAASGLAHELGGLCRLPGTTPVTADCDDVGDCAAGLACFGSRCVAMCDGAHPCANTQSCLPYGLESSNALFGTCN